ncbi:MAG: dihydrolipoamide acetyltransferase family protein [Bowdeniella nasicola]|nr:dihydrolipoamide acetyltransferase family protein [Bowdeniella nasicola]
MATIREFPLPDPGEGLTEATLVRWDVAVGESVRTNAPLAEIETAKSVVEIPCPWDGTVVELVAKPGEEIPVGSVIARFEVESSTDTPPAAARDEASGQQVPADGDDDNSPASGPILVGYGARSAQEPTKVRTLAKPPVRKLAKDLGVDLTTVTATGPGGIITREDVQAAAKQQHARTLSDYPQPTNTPTTNEPWLEGGLVSADGRTTRVPVRSVRRRTAAAMVQSAFTAPHVTVFETVDVTRMIELLEYFKTQRAFQNVRLTPLVMVLRAVALAVRKFPQINASWDEENQEIVYKHYVNLGVAASTPRGLVVPNIKDAHALSLVELAEELATLTTRARSGKTQPHEMSDGTITVTNIGVFGIDSGTPILNPGEAAILAFGAVKAQPWVVDGEIVPRQVATLALSFDHRLVDGELGSRLLHEVAELLEDPARAFSG